MVNYYSGSVISGALIDGQVLSGAGFNNHQHLITQANTDYYPRFTVNSDDNSIASGNQINQWTNVFGLFFKIIGKSDNSTSAELPQGTVWASGDYVPNGSTITIYSTASASVNRSQLHVMMSGGTVNGL